MRKPFAKIRLRYIHTRLDVTHPCPATSPGALLAQRCEGRTWDLGIIKSKVIREDFSREEDLETTYQCIRSYYNMVREEIEQFNKQVERG